MTKFFGSAFLLFAANPQLLQCDIESNLFAVLEAIRHRLFRVARTDRNTFGGIFLNDFDLHITGKTRDA